MKILRKCVILAVCTLFVSSLVYAYNWPCQSSLPGCQNCMAGQTCDVSGTVTGCEYDQVSIYHCNVKDSACLLAPGKCNVMMKTVANGYWIQCSTGTYGFCITTVVSRQTTNIKCGEDVPCDPSEAIIPIPDGGGPGLYNGNTGYNNIDITPLDEPGT